MVPLYAEPETLTLGVTEIDYGGAKMKIFDRERLMCECLKYEDKMERELFKEGLFSVHPRSEEGCCKVDEIRKGTQSGKESTDDDRSMAVDETYDHRKSCTESKK